MSKISKIKILEEESNKRGDLFGRLMGDLFLALGYDQVRLNIHKTGREIDIEAMHRTEPRRVIAECKATKAAVGGDAINKFVGTLDAEKRKNSQTIGYFISLSGFKETAIEQENDAGGNRVILLDGSRVIKELIKGNIISPPEKIMERAGRCASGQPIHLMPELPCELLAHENGWIWVVYFTQNKQRTHFALIHADGEPIASVLAQAIIKADKSIGGKLHLLKHLPPFCEMSSSESQIDEAKKKYFGYLANEYGEITLEGLPADQEVGSHRLKLENIFVPLYLEQIIDTQRDPSLYSEENYRKTRKAAQKERQPVGKVLLEYPRLAILAAPGGGKTTLLKRLAVAYAFSDRKKLIDDNLPRPWLPLYIRCRQLGDKVKLPIGDILSAIPQRAEMSELAKAFECLVNRALRNDNALLLVDGLDEISDESARISFVNQLRTFLATYPINIVVTSREAGFRIVGGTLSAHCKHYKVADFDDDDTKRLTLAWHKEVVGNRPEVRLEAEKLVQTIIESDRVRELAKNPLLLTTLLLVKRWVGQLPTRRTVLYGKAIEVLLMTWNVEGYDPIDPYEAIPQLAFVAFTMMKDGVQTISLRKLQDTLFLARKKMPEVLTYAKLSVPEFIKRVELRSSLLILTGHEIENGTLYPIYEFRHLTFQEYLTAIAVVEGYYPDRKDDDTILRILESHLADENWEKVVPLVAVLAGRKVEPLIRHLIDLCKKLPAKQSFPPHSKVFPIDLLSQCILDEIQISPSLLEEGLEWIARISGEPQLIMLLYKSKFGNILLKIVEEDIISNTNLLCLADVLSQISLDQINWTKSQDLTPQIVEKITAFLINKNPIQKAEGALAVMGIAFEFNHYKRLESAEERSLLKTLGDKLVPILYSEEPYLQLAACWAFTWLRKQGTWIPEPNSNIISRLLEIWIESNWPEVQYIVAWAITEIPIVDRELNQLPELDSHQVDFIRQQASVKESSWLNSVKDLASLTIAFYWKAPWTDEELANLLASKYEEDERKQKFEKLFEGLGESGKAQLKILKQKESLLLHKPKAKLKKNKTSQK